MLHFKEKQGGVLKIARVTAFTPDRELSSQIWYSTKSQTIFPVLVLHPPYLLNHANKSTHQRMWEQPLSLWRVNLLYRAQLEGVMLARKALFHRGLLRQSLGCEKTGGVTQAQRNNNNCTQLLPSFPGEKKKIRSTFTYLPPPGFLSAVPQAVDKAEFKMEVRRCPGTYLSLVICPCEALYFVTCKRQWTSFWPLSSSILSHMKEIQIQKQSFYTWKRNRG